MIVDISVKGGTHLYNREGANSDRRIVTEDIP